MLLSTVIAVLLLICPVTWVSSTTQVSDPDPYGSINTSLLFVENISLEEGGRVTAWSENDRQIGEGTVSGGNVLVVIRGDDEVTSDIVEGARPGETVYLRAHPPDTQSPYALQVSAIRDVLSGRTLNHLAFQNDAFYVLEAAALPDYMQLAKNYPNPFSASTTISYTVPEPSTVTLDVYNTLGQRVATLVDEHKTPGEYTVSVDGTRLSSGIYIYRLRTSSRSISRKMLVVR